MSAENGPTVPGPEWLIEAANRAAEQRRTSSTARRVSDDAFGDLLGRERESSGTSRRASRTRPRGFAPYDPKPDTLALIEATRGVLAEYAEHLPLTLRQVYYRLVSHGVVGKTEKDYARLCEVLGRARRAHLIPMDAFRDDGFRRDDPPGYDDADHFLFNVERWVDGFTLDRQDGQDVRLVVWCEAGGMVPQLERVAHDYSVPVYSSGGFDSITAKHEMARAIADDPRATTVLHVGDLDPSGMHLYGSLDEDIRAFASHYGGGCTFARLAVTPDQVEAYGLPKAPPKPTDRRSFEGMTTQCEALDPRTLADIVRGAIEERQDGATRRDVIEREAHERDTLRARFRLDGGSMSS